MEHALIEELTTTAIEAAAVAAEVQRAGWATGFRVNAKGDHGDSVTDIDIAAEAAIRQCLKIARPDDSLIGEESDAPSELARICWIVDPIDGTANYLRRSDDFAVSIGVAVDGKHIVGVVQQTATGRIWVGSPEECARDGEPIRVAQRSNLADSIWATGFTTDPHDRERQLRFFSHLMTSVRDARRTGSPALDLAHVADGTVDGYVEFGLGHWDYAAGAALVAAAGGVVDIIDVAPWKGPLVIAAGTQFLVDEMRNVLRRAQVPNV
ncbi:MAG: inositol monophosphatase family protein [Ilumatobacter sp.]|uniref:inositol monophosphatase family protein n=1 Tax=Ilumatobacter sp. TaxID=1967498 RepID=UPI00391B2794